MGLFANAVPGGSIAKPLMVALGALLVGKMMGGDGQSASNSLPPSPVDMPRQRAGGLGGLLQGLAGGGLVGGIGGLLDKLRTAGRGDIANSWLSDGPNRPIQPDQLGSALGQTTVSDLAQRAGVSEEELLAQLSRVLPGVVDKLTPNGRVPRPSEIAPHFGL